MERPPEVSRLRRFRVLAAAAATLLLLAGCVRVDSTTELRADDTFDQHLVLAFAPDLADQLGSGLASGLGSGLTDSMDDLPLDAFDPSTLYDQLADSDELKALEADYPGQVEIEPYDDGERVGVELTLTDLPLDLYSEALDTAGAGLGLSAAITHADGEFVVTIPAATGLGASSLGLTDANLGLLGNAVDVAVSFTFPGLVTEAPDGTVEGRTVTLGLAELLSGDDIRIVASDADQIDWTPILTWGGVALAAIVIVGGAALLVLQDVRARRRSVLPAPDASHESRIGTLDPPDAPVAPPEDPEQETPSER